MCRSKRTMQRVTISIDDKIAEAFDALIAKRGYKNRSEAFRDLLRRELAQDQLHDSSETECMAVVSFGFDHHARSLPARMTEQQHAHHESIIASMHVHASHERCVEVVVIRGKYKSISPLAQEMIAETGIENGAVHYVALSSGDHDHHHDHEHTHQHGHETVKD